MQKKLKAILTQWMAGGLVFWLAALLFSIFYYGAGATKHFFKGMYYLSPFLLAIPIGSAVYVVFKQVWGCLVTEDKKVKHGRWKQGASTALIYIFCFLLLVLFNGTVRINFLQISIYILLLALLWVPSYFLLKRWDKKGGKKRKYKEIYMEKFRKRLERENRSLRQLSKKEKTLEEAAMRERKQKSRIKWIWALYLELALTEFFYLLLYAVIVGRLLWAAYIGLLILALFILYVLKRIIYGKEEEEALLDVYSHLR